MPHYNALTTSNKWRKDYVFVYCERIQTDMT